MKITSFFKFAAMTIIATTVMLGATSCSDDDDDDKGEPTPSLFVPEKITINSEILTIAYDNSLRMIKLSGVYEDETYLYEISYDTDGKVSGMTETLQEAGDKSVYRYTFTYSGNLIRVNKYYDGDNTVQQIVKVTVDNENYAKSIETEHEGTYTYTYDNAGKLGSYVSDYYNETFAYGQTIGISKDVNMQKWFAVFLFERDDLFEFLLYWDKSVEKSTDSYESEFINTYTSNSEGYPITCKRVETEKFGSEIVNYTFTYKEIKK